MTRKQQISASKLPVPQIDDEARAAIREIGGLRREILRLEAAMNDEIASLQKIYGDKCASLHARRQELQEGLRIFCEAHRDRLTQGGKVKFHRFSTGEISWRSRPAKVTIRKMTSVIEAIKTAGLSRQFLRQKESVNKEAMLEEPALASAIKGVSIGSEGEDFTVEPFECDLSSRLMAGNHV